MDTMPLNKSTSIGLRDNRESKRRDVQNIVVVIILSLQIFVYFLALPSLLHLSIFKLFFLYL